MKFKKGDSVVITAGKDKGKKGKIEKIFLKSSTVLLPGLNIYKRHIKKKEGTHKGGIIDISRPISVANIAVICPKCDKPTRIGMKLDGSTKKRYCRKCDALI
ncbi:50S ribosomal protein L24 [Candidatus Gottesmanbacteria bacterium]|nr:50S ribosomal protein L24 [Candidatus Gottesmanbacteria bacterium]